MTDMIEKMARAIMAANTNNAHDLARAALSALEEPSEAMIEAGDKSLTWGIVPNDELRAIFTAMIKAAKGEE